MKVGRVTCSDRASAGRYEDKGGPEIQRVFFQHLAGAGGVCGADYSG